MVVSKEGVSEGGRRRTSERERERERDEHWDIDQEV